MLLHILITENANQKNLALGWGGVFVFLIPSINDVFNDYPIPAWAIPAALAIKGDEASYLKMVKRAFDITVKKPVFSAFGSGDVLAKGTDGTVNRKIADSLESWRRALPGRD